MKKMLILFILSLIISSNSLIEARNRIYSNSRGRSCNTGNFDFDFCDTCFAKRDCCLCCNQAPYCGPFPRPLPGQYDSWKDNTKIGFWNLPPCAPRNDSKFRGYLYKGMWWDTTGVRYWAVRNSTNNTITFEGLAGGETKDIPAGDVVNINRGESYSFRVQSPAHRFELFNSDAHHLEVVINLRGDIDYREEIQNTPNTVARNGVTKHHQDIIVPKF